MCTKPFSQTKNNGKQFWVAKSSGPLLGRYSRITRGKSINFNSVKCLLPTPLRFREVPITDLYFFVVVAVVVVFLLQLKASGVDPKL